MRCGGREDAVSVVEDGGGGAAASAPRVVGRTGGRGEKSSRGGSRGIVYGRSRGNGRGNRGGDIVRNIDDLIAHHAAGSDVNTIFSSVIESFEGDLRSQHNCRKEEKIRKENDGVRSEW